MDPLGGVREASRLVRLEHLSPTMCLAASRFFVSHFPARRQRRFFAVLGVQMDGAAGCLRPSTIHVLPEAHGKTRVTLSPIQLASWPPTAHACIRLQTELHDADSRGCAHSSLSYSMDRETATWTYTFLTPNTSSTCPRQSRVGRGHAKVSNARHGGMERSEGRALPAAPTPQATSPVPPAPRGSIATPAPTPTPTPTA